MTFAAGTISYNIVSGLLIASVFRCAQNTTICFTWKPLSELLVLEGRHVQVNYDQTIYRVDAYLKQSAWSGYDVEHFHLLIYLLRLTHIMLQRYVKIDNVQTIWCYKNQLRDTFTWYNEQRFVKTKLRYVWKFILINVYSFEFRR